MTSKTVLGIAAALLLVCAGCEAKDTEESELNGEQAAQSMGAITVAGSASSLTAETIEISTEFTIGEGVEKAAEQLADWYRTQAPCMDVSVSGATVTVDYGELGDTCVWRGKTYAGKHLITFGINDGRKVSVIHAWESFTNGTVTVSGEATAEWSVGNGNIERRVVHELEWTDARGETATGSGDRTQTLLDPSQGLAGGILIDGNHTWEGELGTWELDIDQVEVRGQDPVPQAGTYTLTTPFDGAEASISFERVDDTTIKATFVAGKLTIPFNIKSSGAVTEA